ncbi:heavy metal-binding domain-containing protein [Nocardia sp. NPDC059240]|uniref:heavy metal-binding domain-containing protein n=1 Tax=Nocardia sp. NPDC059240 TaxID=3346786 RepID=UPI0036888933
MQPNQPNQPGQPQPLDQVAGERLSHANRIFTSDLSVNEFALLHGAGFEPIDLVMGVSVYHVGFQFTGIRQQQELPVLTEATYRARWNAMSRMQAEADALKADGVVGVRLEWRQHGESMEHLEFIAVGTAVRFAKNPGSYRRPNGQAFTSHLSGQDMVTLLRTGYAPVAFVMGNCVFHVAVQSFRQMLSQMGRNMEMPQWTQGNYQARELAMSRMQAEAERDGGTGVTGVSFDISNYAWGYHTVEFYASGTAIRRIGDGDPIIPQFTLGLDS